MIEINNLYFSYPNSNSVLESLNLKVERGETIAIIGPNGSGKTTLGFCLCGLVPHVIKGQMKGYVKINGKDTRESKLEDIIRDIGYIFQDPDSQFVTLRVKDELAFGLENIEIDEIEIQKRVDIVSKRFALSDIMDSAPQEISMGQKQKVILASVIAMKPNILVLDEPASNFDPRLRNEFIKLVKKLQDDGFTIIIFSHNFEQVKKLAKRVLVLHNNTFKLDCPSEHIDSNQVLNLFKMENKNIIKNSTNQNSPPLLSFKNISFKYPRNKIDVLKNVSFTVKKGRVLGVAGSNGSGKSTILFLMANLLKPKEGKVIFNGTDVNKISSKEFAKLIGIVFQNPNHQIFSATVLDELKFGLVNFGIPQNEISNRIKKVSDVVDNLGSLDRDPHSLSYGQRKLLTISTVLLMNPDVILFDEPELALDIGSLNKIKNLIINLNKDGKTIVVVSHDLELLEEITHDIIFIDDGHILYEGETDFVIGDVRRFFND